jgi:hypothetical protein
VTSLIALARHVGTASLAGVISGILVGGLLGRLVMRIAGFTAGPALVGAFTANDNRVGDITFAGTVALIIFVGIAAGLVGGMLYAALEPWLRALRPWHGLAYGAALLATFGFLVIEPTNLDFRRFGSPALNVAMFAGLFLAFGVVLAWVFDRLHAIIAGPGRAARPVEILAFLALAPGLLAVAVVSMSVTGLAQPLFPIVFAAGLLIATIARWRRLPALISYASFAVPMLIGAARTFGGLPELLAGF